MYQVREEHRKKYEQYEREQAERREAEKLRVEEERVVEREAALVYRMMDDWDREMDTVHPTPEYIHTLLTRLHPVLPYAHKHAMMTFLSDRAVRLVDVLNRYHTSRTNSIHDVREVRDAMKTLLSLCEVEAEIETMDTSMDELMARQLQEDMYDDTAMYDIRPADMEFGRMEHVERQEALPVCSITRGVKGLTLVQLRALAKENGIPSSGSKGDLCHRLAQFGYVRII